jgi:RNA-directed DNA polymerase
MREQLCLTLSPEKTHITHVDDGFDLLGFRIVRRPRPVERRSPTASQANERCAR